MHGLRPPSEPSRCLGVRFPPTSTGGPTTECAHSSPPSATRSSAGLGPAVALPALVYQHAGVQRQRDMAAKLSEAIEGAIWAHI